MGYDCRAAKSVPNFGHARGEGMRIVKGLIIFNIILIILSLTLSAYAAGNYSIETRNIREGVFTINYSISHNDKVKVMVQKDGTSLYYNLSKGKGAETFPLQMGTGKYTIAVLENISGNRYKEVLNETVETENSNPLIVYLQSIQLVNWDKESEVVEIARELTKDKKSAEEKVKTIYDYIIHNYSYDLGKEELSYDYLPDNDKLIKSKKGMCYDFSSLFASMLRSIDVPTKLVKGYADKAKGYHAWNEVYIDGKWKVIDTSYDAQMAQNGHDYAMYKDRSTYNKVSEY